MTSVDTAPSASPADELRRQMDDLRAERDGLRAERDSLRAERDSLRAECDGLREAMRNRAAIEQAKGILAARHGIDPDVAFDRLRGESQRRNVRLAELAAALVVDVTAATGSSRPRDASVRPLVPRDAVWPEAGSS
jgi:chromosome segregation ATPase